MKLASIVIDDEPLGLASLAEDLMRIPTIEVIGTFVRPFEALDLIGQGRVDLLFLDIQMPTLLGTDFLRSMPRPPLTIFTTAYEQYALEGYELNVVDYLLKPIRFERLLRACTKAHTWQQQTLTSQAGTADTFFFVKTDYRDTKIYHHDIVYIEGLKNYVKIYLDSQPDKPILTRLSLKAIEAQLNPAQFSRIHQSYLVPLQRITSFHRTELRLGRIALPIGERYVEEFLAKYRKC